MKLLRLLPLMRPSLSTLANKSSNKGGCALRRTCRGSFASRAVKPPFRPLWSAFWAFVAYLALMDMEKRLQFQTLMVQ